MRKSDSEYSKTLTSSIENAKAFYDKREEYVKTINDIINGSAITAEDKTVYCISINRTATDSIIIGFDKEIASDNYAVSPERVVDLFYEKLLSKEAFSYNFIDSFLDFLTSFAVPYLYSEFMNRNICMHIHYQIPVITVSSNDHFDDYTKNVKEESIRQAMSEYGIGLGGPFYGVYGQMNPYPYDTLKSQQLKANGFMGPFNMR